MREQVRRLAKPFPCDVWPDLACPICRTGLLAAETGAVGSHTSADARAAYDRDDGEPTDLHGIFYGHLTCTSPKCGDEVAVSGDMTVDYRSGPAPSDDYNDQFETYYQVRTVYPPIEIVQIPQGTPESVGSALLDASAVAWQNPGAGVALLRSSVERLMDEQAIAATTASGGFRPLHHRLAEFEKNNPDVGELLLATKWVGNQGVHPGGLAATDFLDVAEFIELSLDLLYQKDTSALRARAQRILAAKKLVP
ncbi:DUF4145 domain-containing protein [Nocardia sp. XZ_19_385]|uniref:DUF4145 domain-containing protein n=1 Tax=Nocardia sp. XZ_19_385 TaxID=2769488 RepID=UPI0018903134|nr:DUF4145 domain-containing protein [Nocardia sp. XZ_19_385]